MLIKILIALLVIIARHSGTENPDHLFNSPVVTVGGNSPIEQTPIPDENKYERYEDFYYTV